MKRILKIGTISAILSVGLIATAHAQDSFRNLSDAAGDSAEAGGRLVAAGGQVAIGAVAIPIASAGTAVAGVGSAAIVVADGMWDTANAPLEIDEEIVISQPAPDVSSTVNVTTTVTVEQKED